MKYAGLDEHTYRARAIAHAANMLNRSPRRSIDFRIPLTTGAAHRLESSGAFAWHSQRQKLTSRSTTESELIALSSETDDTVVYRQLLADFGLLCKVPTPIWMAKGTEDAPATVYEDNRSAITIIRDRQYGARTKFLDVRLSTLRERERDRILELCECPTEAMLADPFTKPLSQKQHAAMMHIIMNGGTMCQKSQDPDADKGE